MKEYSANRYTHTLEKQEPLNFSDPYGLNQ